MRGWLGFLLVLVVVGVVAVVVAVPARVPGGSTAEKGGFPGRIVVMVYDEASYPLPGANVTVTPLDRRSAAFSAIANADGETRFEKLPLGSYRVDVRFPGHEAWSGKTVLDEKTPAIRQEVYLEETGG